METLSIRISITVRNMFSSVQKKQSAGLEIGTTVTSVEVTQPGSLALGLQKSLFIVFVECVVGENMEYYQTLPFYSDDCC